MNILLIGHEGYLGRGLYSYLRRGHRVIGWGRRDDLFKLSSALLVREKVEMVINLASVADRHSQRFSVGTLSDRVNVEGARHLADVLKGSEISWIQLSTREVLGPVYKARDVIKTQAGLRPKWLVSEEQPYAPVNSYGKSKIIAEFLTESHPWSAVIRLTCCYTDYDHPNGNWVLSLLKAAIQGMPVSLTRGGEQFRDPLHVDDLGRLMELIHKKRAFGETYHAGGGNRNLISIKEVVRIPAPLLKTRNIPGGDYGFAFDNRKAKELTGWEPRILLREKIPFIVKDILLGNTLARKIP